MNIFNKIIAKIDQFAEELLLLLLSMVCIVLGSHIMLTADFTLASGEKFPEPIAIVIGFFFMGMGIWVSYYPVKSIIQKFKGLS